MTALKSEIKKRGIKQFLLAKKLGITPSAVSQQTKTGIRMISQAKKYGDAIGCDPRLLLDL